MNYDKVAYPSDENPEYWLVVTRGMPRICLGVFDDPVEADRFIEWLEKMDQLVRDDEVQEASTRTRELLGDSFKSRASDAPKP